jgi:spore coat polysaccharide biosynthesis protein SpsF
VRLTADNPFVDVQELARLIELYEKSGAQFCHSFRSLPIGVGAEIFSFRALEESYKAADAPHHFEHVDEYLLEHPERFKTVELCVPESKNRPDVRLTIDTEEDYRRACYIVEHSVDPVNTVDAIEICSRFA